MAERERCKECGYKVRSSGHEKGPHHSGLGVPDKAGKRPHRHKIGRTWFDRRGAGARTPGKDKGRGYDFDAVKRGGLPK